MLIDDVSYMLHGRRVGAVIIAESVLYLKIEEYGVVQSS